MAQSCPAKPEVHQIGMQTHAFMTLPALKYGEMIP